MSEEPPKNPSMEEQPSSVLSHTLEIADGCDVIRSLADFALRRQRTIVVLSGSGTVTNVTLSQWPGVTYQEKFEIVSICGSFLPPPAAPRFSGLSAYFTEKHGQVVGGRVLRPMMASGPVVIMAASFTNTVYEEIGKEPLKAEASDFEPLITESLPKGSSSNTEALEQNQETSDQKPEEVGQPEFRFPEIEEEHRLETGKEIFMEESLQDNLEVYEMSLSNTEPLEQNLETAKEASMAESSEQKPDKVGLTDEPLKERSLEYNLEASEVSSSITEPLETAKEGTVGDPETVRNTEIEVEHPVMEEPTEDNLEVSETYEDNHGAGKGSSSNTAPLEGNPEISNNRTTEKTENSKGSSSNTEPLGEKLETSNDGTTGNTEGLKASSSDAEPSEQNLETTDDEYDTEPSQQNLQISNDGTNGNTEGLKASSLNTESIGQNSDTSNDGATKKKESLTGSSANKEPLEQNLETSNDGATKEAERSKGSSSNAEPLGQNSETSNNGATKKAESSKGSSANSEPLEQNLETSNNETAGRTESPKGSSSNIELLKDKPEASNNETTEKTDSSEGSPSNTESLEQNPETVKTISFRFGLSHAMKLKIAILALTDGQVNKHSTGMIEVNSKKVEIMVHNDIFGVCGYLMLYAPMLVNFKLEKPLKKMINLNSVSEYLDMVGDHSTLTIYHIDGSNELSFVSGGLPVIEFGVELHEIDPGFVEFPNITFCCECVIPSELLSKVLNKVDATPLNFASVEVSDIGLLFTIGMDSIERLLHEYDVKVDHRELRSLELSQKSMTTGLVKGQSHRSWFQWPHCEALRKANQLDHGAYICLVTDPKNNVMFRFPLREFGDLLFLKKVFHYKENYNDRTKDSAVEDLRNLELEYGVDHEYSDSTDSEI